VSLSGFLADSVTAIITPGRAVPAEQPHTLLINSSVVPAFGNVLSTSAGLSNSVNPWLVISAFMGATICSGYIFNNNFIGAKLQHAQCIGQIA
jgi:hypothetical protein